MKKTRQGIVSRAGRRIGVIEERAGGRTRFQYDRQWLTATQAEPISVTLPLREEPYEWDGLHPFFANLLPEGWLLEAVSRKFKIAVEDQLGLLLATCGECIGAVEITNADKVD